MENWRKYEKTYFMPPEPCYDWVKKDSIDKAPIWCSVDLRDGNQALIQKLVRETDALIGTLNLYETEV